MAYAPRLACRLAATVQIEGLSAPSSESEDVFTTLDRYPPVRSVHRLKAKVHQSISPRQYIYLTKAVQQPPPAL